MWIELAAADAEHLGIAEGDLVRVESPRGQLEAKARLTGQREGLVFAPFPYGYWGEPAGREPNGHARAANELTITDWDPVSHQPLFKIAAVRVEKLADGDGRSAPAPTTTASEPVTARIAATAGGADVKETIEETQ